MYRSHTPSWNAWSGQSGANISTRCRFGKPRISNENWTRSRNITTVIGCIRGSRDKYPTRELAAKTSQQFASMTTAGNRTAAAYFNYQWRLELEFAPHTSIASMPSGTISGFNDAPAKRPGRRRRSAWCDPHVSASTMPRPNGRGESISGSTMTMRTFRFNDAPAKRPGRHP